MLYLFHGLLLLLLHFGFLLVLMLVLFMVLMFRVLVGMLFNFFKLAGFFLCLPLGLLLLPLRDFLLSELDLLVFLALLVGGSRRLRLRLQIALSRLLFLLDLLRPVLQVEPDWQLEVQLDSAALVLPAKHVEELHIDLRTVEGPVSLVQLVLFAEFAKGCLELVLGQVPVLNVPQILLGTGGQLKHVFEAKN